jgi:glycosyltransferase involved in cell wall biosynthesis
VRVVILHDYLTQSGGAERVVAALLERWPEAELRTLIYDPDGTFEVFAGHDPRTSRVQGLAGRVSHRALLPVLPLAARSLAVSDADLVVSSSSGWAHGIPVAAGIPHICYCHNPPRWLYDARSYIRNPVFRSTMRPLLSSLRRWDQRAARRPTRYVANSHNVRRRIERVYDRRAEVVHPPVDVSRFRPMPLAADGGYLLVLSRLLPYKRVDLAIAAGRALGLGVVVAGDGPDRKRLQGMADSSVEFLGRVDDDEIPPLFAGAGALFNGGEEDFGITPLEANAAGRPVVAYGRGGALETVVDGQTGILFRTQDAASASHGLRRALEHSWSPNALAAHAARFSQAQFLPRFSAIVRDELAPRPEPVGRPRRALAASVQA